MVTWLLEAIRKDVFSSHGSAGPDGSTVNMIVKPGRSIPTMMHATLSEGSQEPDQLAMAIYINGKWYDMGIDGMPENSGDPENADETKFRETADQIVKDVLGENMENLQNVHSLEDVLDLVAINIKGGEILELSSDGLEEVVIPEPKTFEEKAFGTIEPGKKSRPKTETEAESLTEEEELEEAA